MLKALQEFLEKQAAHSFPRALWFSNDHMEVYVRAGMYSPTLNHSTKCVTIANVNVFEKRQGHFRDLLNYLEAEAARLQYEYIVVELIHNPILYDYLRNRRGYYVGRTVESLCKRVETNNVE